MSVGSFSTLGAIGGGDHGTTNTEVDDNHLTAKRPKNGGQRETFASPRWWLNMLNQPILTKHAQVKMGSSSPSFGVKIQKYLKLPGLFSFWE